MDEQLTLMDEIMNRPDGPERKKLIKQLEAKSQPTEPNPCVRLYGPGPANTKCKTCKYLHGITFSKTYYKCQFRGDSRSTATDHRTTWTACAKYEEGKGERAYGG